MHRGRQAGPPRRFGALVALSVLVFATLALLAACARQGDEESETEAAEMAVDVSDAQSCRECHEAVFQSWQGSHHHLANRLVDEERDAEAFLQGEVTDAAGRRYRVRHDASGFFISEEVNGEWREAAVDSVIGETPLQQFLVEAERGRLQTHALSWDPEKGEWFNVFGDEPRERGEWGHWTGQGMNWNANCAACHMTDYKKNYDPMTDGYASAWSQQGISCVRCHDGMEAHVKAARAGDYVAKGPSEPVVAMENCASCHARRSELTKDAFGPGERFHDHYRLMLPDQPNAYFESGQAREENYVYGSLMLSRMGHQGVSCMDCHDPHSHQLVLPAENNALCMSCHATGNKGASLIDPLAHSGHPMGSKGNQCVECHMPERVYMDRDWRRDHGFTTPDPHLTAEYGIPNACSDCHQQEGEEWVRTRFDEMYGESERLAGLRERARLLHAVNAGDPIAAEELLAAHGLADNPYWKATWLRVAGQRGLTEAFSDAAAASLAEGSPIERAASLDILAALPIGRDALERATGDASRMVRIQAADTKGRLGIEPGESSEEWLAFTEMNADNPVGALRLAEVAARRGDREAAQRYISNAVGFDRVNAPLRYDAAILLDRLGLAESGIRHLRVARGLAPEDGRYAHALGLLYGEIGNWERAASSFAAATLLEPEQHRWWYQLAIAQTRKGEVAEAIASLESALEKAPGNAEYEAFLGQLRAGR